MDTRSLRQHLPDTTITYGIFPRGVRFSLMATGFLVLASLAGAFAVRGRKLPGVPFGLVFWGARLVLSISLHGLAITGFWSGGEGLAADVRGLCVVWDTGLVGAARHRADPRHFRIAAASSEWPFHWVLRVSFCRVMTEFSFAMVLVLLCHPTRPFSLGPVVVMLAFRGTVAFVAGHVLLLAEGL